MLPLFSDHSPPPTLAWVASDGTWIGLLMALATQYPDVGVPWGVIGVDPPHTLMSPKDVQTETDRTINSQEVGDAIWRYLVAQVRSQRGAWHLYAISAAEKKLRQATLWFASTTAAAEDIWRAHTDIVGEFLITLHKPTLDLDSPGLARRIVNQAHYYVRTRAHPQERVVLVEADTDDLAYLATVNAPTLTLGHPDFVLARLVKQTSSTASGATLKPEDAELIARTLFEHDENDRRKTIQVAAAELGIKPSAAPMRYHRATRLITRILPRLSSRTRRPPQHPPALPAPRPAETPGQQTQPPGTPSA